MKPLYFFLILTLGRACALEPSPKTVPSTAPSSSAEMDQTAAALRKLIVAGVAANSRPTLELELVGNVARVQVVNADEKGLTVRMESTDLPVHWDELSPDRLGAVAGAFARSGADYVNLARFYALNKMAARAEKAGLAALEHDKSLAADVGTALGKLPKVDPPPANPPAPIATGSPEASKAAASAIPQFKTAYMCDTPGADAIAAAMQIFPKDSPWHQDISKLPVHPNSDKYIANMGANTKLRMDAGMYYMLVPPDQPRVEVKVLAYKGPMDAGPFPVPPNMPVEGWSPKTPLDQYQRATGGDRHGIAIDPFRGLGHEFFNMRLTDKGWTCSSTATWDLTSNTYAGRGASEAAGLSIFAALIRHDELERGVITHAMRVAIPKTRKAHIFPAQGDAGLSDDPLFPPMGLRVRLKATADLNGLSKEARTIAIAMQKYGMFVADNGGDWDVDMAADKRIDYEKVRPLNRFKGSDFEAVYTGEASDEHKKK
jgi:hypothetical protein